MDLIAILMPILIFRGEQTTAWATATGTVLMLIFRGEQTFRLTYSEGDRIVAYQCAQKYINICVIQRM